MTTRKLVLLGILALLAACVGAEAIVRARAHARYGEYLDIYDIHHRLESGLLVPLASLDTEFGKVVHIHTDERGFRSPSVAVPKPAGTLRLAFLGASTTFCSQVGDAETWPSLVVAELGRLHPEVRVEQVNAGVTSYRLRDTAQALGERVAAVQPDVIVIYHAANDLAEDTLGPAVAAGLAEAEGPPGWLERHSLLAKLIRKNRRLQAAMEQAHSDGPRLDCDLAALARGFEQRLTDLVRQAAQVADLVVLPTYVTQFDASQPPERQLAHMQQSHSFMPYFDPERMLRAFAAYGEAIERSARSTGALLIDERAELQGRPLCFTDSVHFSVRGCEQMARRVVRGLEASADFQRLVLEVTGGSPGDVSSGGSTEARASGHR